MTAASNRLCVIHVSDYDADEQKNWQNELTLLEALSNQDIEEDFDVVLVQSTPLQEHPVPDQLYLYVPQLKILYYDSHKSTVLKDYGVSQCDNEFIALIEAGGKPTANWLRLLLNAMESGAEAAASGRTVYGESTSYRRVCNMLHWAWDDQGHSGKTDKVADNGAIYRREILQAFPYPHAVNPCAATELRNSRIKDAGETFYFAREAAIQHAVGGLSFLWDLQWSKGHHCMTASKHKRFLSLAKEKLKGDWHQAFRLGPVYLRWYDWPLFVCLALYEVMPHLIGARCARENVEAIHGSSYR